LCDFV